MDTSNSKAWQAHLTPHRSLDRNGFIAVMGLIAVVNFAVGVLFMAIGAWPVAGFAGLDVLLMYWAFRANFAAGEGWERISITGSELIVERQARRSQPERHTFNRRWTRVELAEDKERELVGSLAVVSGGRRLVIGQFLSAEERQTLAHALKSQLAIPRI